MATDRQTAIEKSRAAREAAYTRMNIGKPGRVTKHNATVSQNMSDTGAEYVYPKTQQQRQIAEQNKGVGAKTVVTPSAPVATPSSMPAAKARTAPPAPKPVVAPATKTEATTSAKSSPKPKAASSTSAAASRKADLRQWAAKEQAQLRAERKERTASATGKAAEKPASKSSGLFKRITSGDSTKGYQSYKRFMGE